MVPEVAGSNPVFHPNALEAPCFRELFLLDAMVLPSSMTNSIYTKDLMIQNSNICVGMGIKKVFLLLLEKTLLSYFH